MIKFEEQESTGSREFVDTISDPEFTVIFKISKFESLNTESLNTESFNFIYWTICEVSRVCNPQSLNNENFNYTKYTIWKFIILKVSILGILKFEGSILEVTKLESFNF